MQATRSGEYNCLQSKPSYPTKIQGGFTYASNSELQLQAEIGRLNRNISGDATAFQPKILYHLRNSHASRNTRSMLAVIFIPKKERKMILWQQQKNYHQGHVDA